MANETVYVDKLIKELFNLCGNMVFLEDYSHENSVCWKILNPFTQYASAKLVLCKMDDGIEKALVLAIEHIGKRKIEYFGKAD